MELRSSHSQVASSWCCCLDRSFSKTTLLLTTNSVMVFLIMKLSMHPLASLIKTRDYKTVCIARNDKFKWHFKQKSSKDLYHRRCNAILTASPKCMTSFSLQLLMLYRLGSITLAKLVARFVIRASVTLITQQQFDLN